MNKKWLLALGCLGMGLVLGFAMVYGALVLLEEIPLPQGTPEQPETYLPQSGQRYTYQNTYPDGTQLDLQVLVLRLKGGPLLTAVEVPPESEPYVVHYVPRENGLHTVWESDPSNDFLYLPASIEPGVTWEDRGVFGKILGIGETVDTAGDSYEDCIKVEHVYSETGDATVSWYAPGKGLVRSEYADSGELREQLIKYEPLNLLSRLWGIWMAPGAKTMK